VDRHRGVIDAGPPVAEPGRHREPHALPRRTSQTRRRSVTASLRRGLSQLRIGTALILVKRMATGGGKTEKSQELNG